MDDDYTIWGKESLMSVVQNQFQHTVTLQSRVEEITQMKKCY